MLGRLVRVVLALLLVTVALAGCADNPAPQDDDGSTATGEGPDFGDAPDGAPTGYRAPYATTGSFPTKLASDGARAEDLSQARLGAGVTGEADAQDPDADDGIVEMVLVLTQLPPPAALTVRASAPAGSDGGTFHVNVLFDQDLDGAWSEAEWVVQNHPVEIAAGDTVDVALPPFALTQSIALPDGAWMRVALTKERIDGPWTGAGAFAVGEVEDHVVRFPQVDGKNPAIAVMTCPEKVSFGDEDTVVVTCQLSNVAPVGHGDQISWRLTRLTGGVTIAPTQDVETIAPGVTIAVSFTATKGEPLPSRWAYNAVGIDPPSRVTDTGVEVGHGESEGEIEFGQTALACAVLIAEIETSREHRAGESDAIFWVFVKRMADERIQEGIENARVTGTMQDGTAVEGVTDAAGRAEIRHTVYSYGEYALNVENVEADGCEYDAERSQTQATASVQPD